MTRIVIALCAIILSACGGSGGGSSGGGSQACVKPSPALSNAPVLVAYGDSTMSGSLALLRDALADQGVVVEYDNRGVGGTMLHQLMEGSCEYQVKLATDLADDPAAQVVIENFGINESIKLIPPATYEVYLRKFVSTVRAAGKTPVIVTPIHVLDSSIVSQGQLATMAQIGRNVAADMDVRLVDAYTIDAVPGDFRADLIHPTAEFYRVVADFTAGQVKDLLLTTEFTGRAAVRWNE